MVLRWPRPYQWINYGCLLYLAFSGSIIFYGIGLWPIYQGTVGILTSLEGYFGSLYRNKHRVMYFMYGNVINVIWAMILGVTAFMSSENANCYKFDTISSNDDGIKLSDRALQDCSTAYQLYAWIQIGYGGFSFLLVLFTWYCLGNFQSFRGCVGASK